jgi:eukaryotic-like serine/threonine-protein kinase
VQTGQCKRGVPLIDTGQLIAGHYRVLDRIGSGGMGVVWQARDERLQRLVAVKQLLLQPDLSPRATEEARLRALREARIAARLQHPNAIVVYDVAEHDGEPCLVMEYLPSRSLAAVLAEQRCLPVSEVASIGKQVASALAAAHAAHIVHRDVKPGNILITESGTAKITDFGVSRAAGDITVTQTGMMAGTPAYLAPEVARGQFPTQASDVFSLGATLYAAVEGRAPFGDGDNQLALLHAVATGEVPPPRHAGALFAVLMNLLAKDPTARPDMDRACRELAAVRTTRPVNMALARQPTPTRVVGPVNPPPTEAWSPAPASPSEVGPPPSELLPPKLLSSESLPPKLLSSEPLSSEPLSSEPLSSEPLSSEPLSSEPLSSEPLSSRPPPAGTVQPRQERSRDRARVLVGAILAVLALAGTGVLLSGGSSEQQGAPSGMNPATSAPTLAPTPAAPPAPPQVQPVASQGSIAWRDAGQLVIDYYNGLDNLASAWALLSPTARAFFGNEPDFRSHWSQYSSVSARNAFGVTDNPDGTVTVPVDVTYTTTGGGTQVVKRQLRVTRLDGQLLIDSDPR